MDTKNKEQLTFVQDLMDDIDPDLSSDAIAAAENEVFGYVDGLTDQDTRLLAITALKQRAKSRTPEFDDLVYGSHDVMEAPGSEVGRLTERLLSGKNSALIVRAGQYEDLDKDILEPIERNYGLFMVHAPEVFPNPLMRREDRQSTQLHLDINPEKTHDKFPYTLTVSQVEKGRILFIAGLGPKKSYGWQELDYEMRKTRLTLSPSVHRLYRQASQGNPPALKEWHVQEPGVDVDLTAILLNPGDVAIWPQGGDGSEKPAWHGVRQIGSEPRQSISYHLGPVPEEVDLRRFDTK